MRAATISAVAVAVAVVLGVGGVASADATLRPAIGITGKGGMVLVKSPTEKRETPAYSLTGKPTADREATATRITKSNSVHH